MDLVYNMYFGRVFTGSQEELESRFFQFSQVIQDPVEEADRAFGCERQASLRTKQMTKCLMNPTADAEDQLIPTMRPAKMAQSKPGRYVFVTVDFDQAVSWRGAKQNQSNQ